MLILGVRECVVRKTSDYTLPRQLQTLVVKGVHAIVAHCADLLLLLARLEIDRAGTAAYLTCAVIGCHGYLLDRKTELTNTV